MWPRAGRRNLEKDPKEGEQRSTTDRSVRFC
jgi:hypothetical protein